MEKLILGAVLLAASLTANANDIDVLMCDLYPVNRYAAEEAIPHVEAAKCVVDEYGVNMNQVKLQWLNAEYSEYMFYIVLSNSTLPVYVVNTEIEVAL